MTARWWRSPDAGFTLAELLIVVAILGVVAVVIGQAVVISTQSAGTTTQRLKESHDAQIASAYLAMGIEVTLVSSRDRVMPTEDPDATHHRIGWIETAEPFARQRPARFGEAEEGPGAFALPRGQTRLDQEAQMARDARLRLAENGGKFAHRQFGGLQQAGRRVAQTGSSVARESVSVSAPQPATRPTTTASAA